MDIYIFSLTLYRTNQGRQREPRNLELRNSVNAALCLVTQWDRQNLVFLLNVSTGNFEVCLVTRARKSKYQKYNWPIIEPTTVAFTVVRLWRPHVICTATRTLVLLKMTVVDSILTGGIYVFIYCFSAGLSSATQHTMSRKLDDAKNVLYGSLKQLRIRISCMK